MLFRASSFVAPPAEASLLSDRERQQLHRARSWWRTKEVRVATLDVSAIQSGTIALELPDRSVYRFKGTLKESTPGYYNWTGAPYLVDVPAATASTTPTGHVGVYLNGLDLFVDRARTYVAGRLAVGDRHFTLQPLNAKYMMLVESGLNPTAPPIDAEQTDRPRTVAPRSGAEWPTDRLTSKLRASLATSSIGASVSPEYCRQIDSCGTTTRINCNLSTHGPEMFFDNTTGSLIMACGGACEFGPGLPGSKRCTACPPTEWKRCTGDDAARQVR